MPLRLNVRMAFNFFTDDGTNYEVQNMLGAVRTGCGDAGEILATVATITDGDATSWVSAWQATADRVAKIADDALAAGHHVSARDAYLRAASYYAAVLPLVDGVADADKVLHAAFVEHRRCFDAYISQLDVPGEKVDIPYEGSTMPGYFFAASTDGTPRRTIILNNGSDGAVTTMFPGFGWGAVERGYHVLVFDGPGQQSMLFDHKVPFRADWEQVITPVVDFLRARPDVDDDRIAIYGISQAGYWVPRALAFEHRLAGAVVDPGVIDVSTSWLGHLPESMVPMLHDKDKKTFDEFMDIGNAASTDPMAAQLMAWRGKPYGITDPYDLFTAVMGYTLDDLPKQITTPMLVTDPEGEQFWPGQSQRLYDALPGPKELVKFTAAEGADRHCEPMARSLVEQRILDWLDTTMP
ncbi:alpha/beta fold hydrolase [soil metagenome]